MGVNRVLKHTKFERRIPGARSGVSGCLGRQVPSSDAQPDHRIERLLGLRAALSGISSRHTIYLPHTLPHDHHDKKIPPAHGQRGSLGTP